MLGPVPFVRVCAAYLIAGGLSSLCGWVFNVPRLTDWYGNGISIQPNATLCAIGSGLSLWLTVSGRARGAVLCAAVVLTIAGLTVLEWLSGVSLGIDKLLLFDREFGRVGVIHLGRMGPPGSTSWTLIGAALVSMHVRPAVRGIAVPLAYATSLLSALSLTGYLYRLDLLYSLPFLTVIALQTSTFVAAASVAIFACHPAHEPVRTLTDSGTNGILARRALPILVLGPVMLGWLSVRGQTGNLFDKGFGTALLVITLVVLLLTLLWWSLAVIRRHELREREAVSQLRATLESITDSFCSVDAEGRLTYANPACAAALEVPSQSLAGRAYADVFSPNGDGPLARALHRCVSERKPVELEFFHPPTERWEFVRVFPTSDGGFTQYALDITDRKRDEQLIRDAARRKDEFLATLAHELRNPLAPIRSGVDLLRLGGIDAETVDEVTAMMARQVTHLVRLIDDLLEVSRIAQGKITLQKQRLSVDMIVRNALEVVDPQVVQGKHTLEVHLPSEPLLLHVDANRMTQILGNLLHNACKYTEPGGHITLTIRRRDQTVDFSVRDTGAGLPADMLVRVFERFAQVDRTLGRAQGGLGIGLALVKELVELHGGTVTAHSDGPGSGSEFVVRLPLAPQEE
jgi:PAS domain S-box-containing protein